MSPLLQKRGQTHIKCGKAIAGVSVQELIAKMGVDSWTRASLASPERLIRHISEKDFSGFSVGAALLLVFKLCSKQLIAVKPLHRVGHSQRSSIPWAGLTRRGESCSYLSTTYTLTGSRHTSGVSLRMTAALENAKMGASRIKIHLSMQIPTLQPDSRMIGVCIWIVSLI